MKRALHITLGVLLCQLWLPVEFAYAQSSNPDVELQVELEPVLSPFQIMDLGKLGTGERAPGARELTITIRNNGMETVDDLYLDIGTFKSDGGLLF